MSKEIVVCWERWHLIGDVEETKQGVTIKNCSTIRYWGTTAGLGEIAVKGVTEKTILDFNGEVRVPTNSIVMRIKCEVPTPVPALATIPMRVWMPALAIVLVLVAVLVMVVR
jgi:hypothetical protein